MNKKTKLKMNKPNFKNLEENHEKMIQRIKKYEKYIKKTQHISEKSLNTMLD